MKNRRQRNKKLLTAGISIIVGLTLMRLAWIIIDQRWATATIISGSILFLGGVVFSAITFFNKTRY